MHNQTMTVSRRILFAVLLLLALNALGFITYLHGHVKSTVPNARSEMAADAKETRLQLPVTKTERTLIMLHSDRRINVSVLERLLELHSTVVYYRSDAFGPAWRGMVYGVSRKLYECSSDTLSIVVDYMNTHRLSAGASPWCSGARTARKAGRRHPASRQTRHCTPAPKHYVRRFCASHHVALEVEDSDVVLRASNTDDAIMTKIVDLMVRRNITSDEDRGDWNFELTGGRTNGRLAYQRFYSDDLQPARLLHTILELYNFLDLILEDRVVRWLLEIADVRFLSDMKLFAARRQIFINNHVVGHKTQAVPPSSVPIVELRTGSE